MKTTDFAGWLKKKRIGVLYGGWSAEREVSLNSGRNVINALKGAGYNVVAFDVHRNFIDKLEKLKLDIAFIALHGTYGEDGRIQSVLEILGIPYTGSNALASMLSMNKIVAKKMFEYHGLPTPKWTSISKTEIISPTSIGMKARLASLAHFIRADKIKNLGLPLVVKPATQGSAIGVSIVKKHSQLLPALKEAFKYDDSVIVEEYIAGKELTVGILGEEALPVIEIIPIKGKFYDYKAKYAAGGSEHIVPARLDKKIYKKVQMIAKDVFDVLGCTGAARIDFRLTKDSKPYILEINTIPGMTRTSLLPDAAREAGYSFEDLVLKLIEYSVRI